MAIKAMLKTLDGVAETVKPLYRKDGEQFILDVEAVDGFALTGNGLTSALTKERQTVAELQASLETFKGLDPVKAREALEKVKGMDTWTPGEKTAELVEKRGKDVAAAKEAEYASKLKRAEAIEKAHQSLVIDKALEDAAAKHKFLAPQLAPKLFRENMRLDERDGVFIPVIVGTDGKPAIKINTKDGSSVPLTIDEFMADKAKDPLYAPLIAGTRSTGTGGTVPSTNGNGREPAYGVNRLEEAKQAFAATLLK